MCGARIRTQADALLVGGDGLVAGLELREHAAKPKPIPRDSGAFGDGSAQGCLCLRCVSELQLHQRPTVQKLGVRRLCLEEEIVELQRPDEVRRP